MSPDTIQIILYAGIVVFSLGAGGGQAETCDVDNIPGLSCEGREIAFIVFSFLTFITAFPLLVGLMFDFFIIKKVQVFIAPVVVLFSLVATAVGSSPKTSTSVLFQLLSWFTLYSATAALALAVMIAGRGEDHDSGAVPLTAGINREGIVKPGQAPYKTQPAQPGTIPAAAAYQDPSTPTPMTP